MEINRVKRISKEYFLNNYLKKNIPVVVTDAMDHWDVNRFQPESMQKEFGSEYTQVYNDLFDLQNVASLSSYLKDNFSKPDKDCKQYIRWYTKLKEVDFLWSDEVFEKLKNSWNHPYFIPTNSLVIPFAHENEDINITTKRFPYKGLFISGKGARTRLHRDPFNSNAVLCQLYGKKEIKLYSPDQAKYLMNNDEFVNIKDPDLNKFPDFLKAKITYQLTLSPREIILFPSGWFHDVTCASDSVSITWNFIHSSGLKDFQSFILQHSDDDQLEIVRFFLKKHISSDATVENISQLLGTKFAESKV